MTHKKDTVVKYKSKPKEELSHTDIGKYLMRLHDLLLLRSQHDKDVQTAVDRLGELILIMDVVCKKQVSPKSPYCVTQIL